MGPFDEDGAWCFGDAEVSSRTEVVEDFRRFDVARTELRLDPFDRVFELLLR